MRAPFSLSLFGSIELRGPTGAATELLVQSKAVALLAYLSVPSSGRFATVEEPRRVLEER